MPKIDKDKGWVACVSVYFASLLVKYIFIELVVGLPHPHQNVPHLIEKWISRLPFRLRNATRHWTLFAEKPYRKWIRGYG